MTSTTDYDDDKNNSNNDDNTSNKQQPGEERKAASRSTSTTRLLGPAQEQLFETMHLRKIERKKTGKIQQASGLAAVLVLLILLYGTGVDDYEIGLAVLNTNNDSSNGNSVFSNDVTSGSATASITSLKIVLEFWQIVLMAVWIIVAFIVKSITSNRVQQLLLYSVVYWPLCAIVASLIFYGDLNPITHKHYFILVTLLTTEFCWILFFINYQFIYPKFIRWVGAGRFWNVRCVAKNMMTYEGVYGRFGKRYICQYTGETNKNGLPHGSGQWTDDSNHGEVLTGYWNNGRPTAPFLSRQYGNGSAFRAVNIMYFMATDDDFDKNKWTPTNIQDARVGVASVECSIHGAFYNNLPLSTNIYGPHKNEGTGLSDCLRRMPLPTLKDQNGIHPNQDIHIRTDDMRGLQVEGHVYKPTGLPYALAGTVDSVVVDIKQHHSKKSNIRLQFEESELSPGLRQRKYSVANFMPRASRAFKDEKVLVLDRQNSSDKSVGLIRERSNGSAISLYKMEEGSMDQYLFSADDLEEHPVQPKLQLELRDWTSKQQVEALIFFPGFKCPVKNALETFGQLLSMTKISSRVYPILYAYPNGKTVTYRKASVVQGTDRNKTLLLELLQGLQKSGFRTVHFMSHSLGVQTIMAAFEDINHDQRSDVSRCFELSSGFDISTTSSGSPGKSDSDDLMTCKSITMLNPDYSVKHFVRDGFRSLRRVCSLITVVGDSSDQALYTSQLLNGICNFFGVRTRFSELVQGSHRGFLYQRVIGRDFDQLHLPTDDDDSIIKSNNPTSSVYCEGSGSTSRLVFQYSPPMILRENEEELKSNLWLDIDVIDTTSLDTNLNKLRHSTFNINPILLKDFEELILTGQRAMHRSALLYREGNMFSYCHAPSHIAM